MGEMAQDVRVRGRVAVPCSAQGTDQLRALARMSDHNPLSPDWICRGCGDLWPCETRRQQLLAEFFAFPQDLGLLMGSFFGAAIKDRPRWSDEGIYERFFGWIRQR
jgi:hypothetical protein